MRTVPTEGAVRPTGHDVPVGSTGFLALWGEGGASPSVS